jgi:hypothetical protein
MTSSGEPTATSTHSSPHQKKARTPCPGGGGATQGSNLHVHFPLSTHCSEITQVCTACVEPQLHSTLLSAAMQWPKPCRGASSSSSTPVMGGTRPQLTYTPAAAAACPAALAFAARSSDQQQGRVSYPQCQQQQAGFPSCSSSGSRGPGGGHRGLGWGWPTRPQPLAACKCSSSRSGGGRSSRGQQRAQAVEQQWGGWARAIG